MLRMVKSLHEIGDKHSCNVGIVVNLLSLSIAETYQYIASEVFHISENFTVKGTFLYGILER